VFLLLLLLHRLTLIVCQKKKMAKLPSFLVKTIHQISAKRIAFQQNLPRKFPQNRLFFTNSFSVKFAPKIPMNFPQNRSYFCEFISENTAKFYFFSATFQKPCIVSLRFIVFHSHYQRTQTFRNRTSCIIQTNQLSYISSPGRYSGNFWVGMCCWDPGILSLYQS